MAEDIKELREIIKLGEGQTVEFKESVNKLEREFVAFANASGGIIYCGISDRGEFKGIEINNKLLSEIQDIARNCDPPISVNLQTIDKQILAIKIAEGAEKPYQCNSGFYLRLGPNTQKLKSQEVRNLFNSNMHFFDSVIHSKATVDKYLSPHIFIDFCERIGVDKKLPKELILESFLAAKQKNKASEWYLTNAGVLVFTEEPRKLIPESYLTAVRYLGTDKFSISDRQELFGNVISQIEGALEFAKRHISKGYEITGDAKRREYLEYPLVAIREAIINAVIHRDYTFQNSCIYLNIFSDRLEIENPGGIPTNASSNEIEGRSLRRNPILADLLFRIGFGEKLGSGLIRIKQALKENGNPPHQISATNFFSIRFLPGIVKARDFNLTQRQLEIMTLLRKVRVPLSSTQIATHLNVSSTTVFRDLKKLLTSELVEQIGLGKASRYQIQGDN